MRETAIIDLLDRHSYCIVVLRIAKQKKMCLPADKNRALVAQEIKPLELFTYQLFHLPGRQICCIF